MSKKVLGLDIGIASVGWGIVDKETGEVIDKGVRLFEEGTKKGNEERRTQRGARRLSRRRKHRRDRIEKLFIEEKLIDKNFRETIFNDTTINPYEIRIKGLNEQLSHEDLFVALMNIAKRRGSSGFEIISDSKESDDEKSTKAALGINSKELEDNNMFVCQLQLQRYNNSGKLRGHINSFETKDYVKEVVKILSNQNTSDEFNSKVIEIITSKREYFVGPGSKKSPTPYGRYRMENGKLTDEGLIERMKGKCTYFPGVPRSSKNTYSAQLFNVLNDLNNISILSAENRRGLTKEEKEIFLKTHIVKGTETGGIKNLVKQLGIDIKEISGSRINAKGIEIITEFKGLKQLVKVLKAANVEYDVYSDRDVTDSIIEILTDKKGVEERVDALKLLGIDVEICNALSRATGMTGYHSLSKKAIELAVDEMIESNENSMQIFSTLKIGQNKLEDLKGKVNIPFDDEAILSPVAKRSQKQTLNILNRLRKKYGEFESVVIETAREKNSDEAKKYKNKFQKENEERNKKNNELLSDYDVRINNKLRQKLTLYKLQDCKCAYSFETIDKEQLILDPNAYEIDHIIPISVSFDDSMNNKVLCKSSENQKKSNMTPYKYFSSGLAKIDYNTFVANTLVNKNISKNKRKLQNLFYSEDITKHDTKLGFVQRNLVDTRYACRVILNTLQDYYKANEIDTKVHTIKGSVTSLFRKVGGLNKVRDEDHKHHAIDALIVAGIKGMNLIGSALNADYAYNNKNDVIVNNKTGEIISLDENDRYLDSKFINFVKKLGILDNFRYSWKVDKKINRKLTNQTIYGIRRVNDKNMTVGKYKNIYGDDGEKLAKKFNKNDIDDLLMYKHDRKTFDKVKQVYDNYKQHNNPFAEYQKEHGEITKYSKNDNGPKIFNVKYINNILGSHENISHKYGNNTENPSVVLLSIEWHRVDVFKNDNDDYKFLKVDYKHVSIKDGTVVLNPKGKEYYEEEKTRRKITNDYEFEFSLYKNDYFKYIKEDKGITTEEIVRFNGCDYNSNRLEYKRIYRNDYSAETLEKFGYVKDKSQKYLTIGKKIKLLDKYNADILGVKIPNRVKN